MDIIAEYRYDGMKHVEFKFKNKTCIALMNEDESKRNGKTVFKTEYFGAFPDLQNEFVRRGYTLIFIENRNRWGTPDQMQDQYEFIKYATGELGISSKVITIGMSCGGFHAVCFASRYPSYVSLLYLDAPLLSFYGWTAGFEGYEKWQNEQITAYGFRSKAEIYTHNDQPIHRLKTLTENRLPVALVYGGADKVVDPKSNSEVVADFYRLENAPIKVWYKPDCDHHPHGLDDSTEIIEYIKNSAL